MAYIAAHLGKDTHYSVAMQDVVPFFQYFCSVLNDIIPMFAHFLIGFAARYRLCVWVLMLCATFCPVVAQHVPTPIHTVMQWRQQQGASATIADTPQHTASFALSTTPPSPKYEVRAAWLTTYLSLDWPRTQVKSPADTLQQQRELLALLDGLKAIGTNVVLFQVRTRGAVLYASQHEPWDVCLTGQFGRSPHYDPLAFAIQACHARGMQLHAWLVTFPLAKLTTAKSHGTQGVHLKQKQATLKTSENYMLDPGHPTTAHYLATLATEIVTRYAVDGIHLDYVRYPENSIRYDDTHTYRTYGRGQNKADWQRDNVTRVVAHVAQAVKAIRPWVRMSASPVGKYADTPRYPAGGWNARDAVKQDAALWLQHGYMDMLFPMMYFRDNHFFPFALDWQERSYGRTIVPGLGTYMLTERQWPLSDLTRQLHTLRRWGMGHAHFRTQFALDDSKGVRPVLHQFCATPAFVPPMTWADSLPPAAPQQATAHLVPHRYGLSLHWQPVHDDTPVTYRIYAAPIGIDTPHLADLRQLLVADLKTPSFTYTPAQAQRLYTTFAITAVDAYGNESAPCLVRTTSHP